MVAIADYMTEQAVLVRRDLNTMTDNYERLSDDELLARSKQMANHLTEFFAVQQALVDEVADRDGDLKAMFKDYLGLRHHIMNQYDMLVMVHVDEPHTEYRQRLQDISTSFQPFLERGYRDLLNRAQVHMDDERERRVLEHAKLVAPPMAENSPFV